MDPYQKKLISLARENARRHRLLNVFRDFCEMAAISVSNAVDKAQFAVREMRYLDIARRYSKEELARFSEMLGLVVDSLEARYHDCLGELFMSMDLGSECRGQYFTPYALSALCARAMLGGLPEALASKEFVTVNEPTSGAGGMIIALAEAMHDAGYNYQQRLHVIAQDIDATAVHMTYIQLSLLYVPAIVLQGNTLSCERPLDQWVTPAHVLDGWSRKLARSAHADAGEPTPSRTDPCEAEAEAIRAPVGGQLALL